MRNYSTSDSLKIDRINNRLRGNAAFLTTLWVITIPLSGIVALLYWNGNHLDPSNPYGTFLSGIMNAASCVGMAVILILAFFIYATKTDNAKLQQELKDIG